MEPLIQGFSKNLSGCSGCGSKDEVYETWSKAKEKGEKMTFIFEVTVDADNMKQAIGKFPDGFEVLKGIVKPEPKPQAPQSAITSNLARPTA